MRTLHFIKSPEKRSRIAKETMDIYAPLAERIGMYEYMREMQLLAFEQLEPEAYQTITGRLKQIRDKADVEIDQINQTIAWEMEQAGLKIKISGREKHPYSIWKKMQERHVAFEQLTDINAFRVITETTEDCYRALGVLHRRWQMVPGRFKDFISTPKRNGYKSIHTTIMFAKNMRVEVQISDGMEYGGAGGALGNVFVGLITQRLADGKFRVRDLNSERDLYVWNRISSCLV
jgi:GTP pyrophosphokinase